MGEDAEPEFQPRASEHPAGNEQGAERVDEMSSAEPAEPASEQAAAEPPTAEQAATEPAPTDPRLRRWRAQRQAGSTTVPPRRRRASKLELPILIVIAIAIAVVLKTFVVQPFYIPSQSMEQTLHGCPSCAGDRILVFKPVFKVRDPHPGDVVVFKAPADWDGAGVTLSGNPVVHAVQWFGQLIGVVPPSEKDLVKRVIAIGGQTVRCCDDNGNVQISDHGATGPWRSLTEPYIYQNSSWTKPTTPGVRGPDDSRTFGPVTVPAGRLWVMGDHRNDSADSRYHCGDPGPGPNCDPLNSTVPVSDVIGKAVVIAWPPSRWRTLGTPKTFTALGLPGLGALPAEPAAFAVAGVGLVGWRRRRRR
jgi:signal peptidase I